MYMYINIYKHTVSQKAHPQYILTTLDTTVIQFLELKEGMGGFQQCHNLQSKSDMEHISSRGSQLHGSTQEPASITTLWTTCTRT